VSADLAQRAAPYTELDDGAFLTPGVTIANDLRLAAERGGVGTSP
jgi:hypothetical protein